MRRGLSQVAQGPATDNAMCREQCLLPDQEEEETDELLLLDEEMLDADPEDLPRRLLTNFAVYNAEVGDCILCQPVYVYLHALRRIIPQMSSSTWLGDPLLSDKKWFRLGLEIIRDQKIAAGRCAYRRQGGSVFRDVPRSGLVVQIIGRQRGSCKYVLLQGLYASLELLPMWSGLEPDVQLFASGRVLDDDGEWAGGQTLGEGSGSGAPMCPYMLVLRWF